MLVCVLYKNIHSLLRTALIFSDFTSSPQIILSLSANGLRHTISDFFRFLAPSYIFLILIHSLCLCFSLSIFSNSIRVKFLFLCACNM